MASSPGMTGNIFPTYADCNALAAKHKQSWKDRVGSDNVLIKLNKEVK
jgi:hypothetical protein